MNLLLLVLLDVLWSLLFFLQILNLKRHFRLEVLKHHSFNIIQLLFLIPFEIIDFFHKLDVKHG